MKLRSKLRLAYLVWLLGGSFFVLFSIYVSMWFLAPLLALFIGTALFVLLLRCPRCRKPVTNNPIRILGVELWLSTPWMPRRCSRCGSDLD